MYCMHWMTAMILTKCLNSCAIMHDLLSDPFTNEIDDISPFHVLASLVWFTSGIWGCTLNTGVA